MSPAGTLEAGDRRLRLVAPEGSYAATRLRRLARVGLRAHAELDRLLGGQEGAGPVTFRLTDPVSGSGDPGDRVLTVGPETPESAFVTALVVERMRDGYGGAAGSAVIVEGLSGVVAARSGAGPQIEEIDESLRSRLEGGEAVTIFERDVPAGVATSFVAAAIERFGADQFRSFLASYDPERPDQAARAAFHIPIGTIEEGWLSELARRKGPSPLRSFVRQVFPLMRPHWRRQLELGLYRLLGLGYGLTVPLAGKYLIDDIIPSGEVRNLIVFISVLGAIYVVNAIVQMRSAYLRAWLNLTVLTSLQEKMFAHLQRLSHGYYSHAKIGDVMTRLTGDMQVVQQAMTTVADTGAAMTLTALSAAVVLFVLSPLLAVMVLVVVPLFAITYLALQKRFRRAAYERQRIAGETTNLVQENLSAQTVIKAYGMEKRAVDAFVARLGALFRTSLRLTVLGSVFETSMSLASTLGQMLVFGVGGYLVIEGSLTVGTMLAFIALIPNLFQPLAALSGVGQQIEIASGSMARITELMEEPVEIADAAQAVELPVLARGITFENVSFGYGGQRMILKGLDLAIPAGSHVAVVGPSGAGKSTIVNLVLRFWDPEEGTVAFDGIDLRSASLDSLRSQIGLVFQDTFIFDTTLRENIAIGKPDATDAEVGAAAKTAALDGFVGGLPAGFDTVLGERGVRMSGGQRQRLAIARAVLRDPRILILDEATSSLDAQTEQEIVETLIELARGRTTITITHRLGLAARADRIVAISNGVVVEEGTHEELLSLGGLYRSLYDEQMGVSTHRAPVVQMARLREVPLFEALGADTLEAVAERLVPERFPPGDDIVRQGEAGDKFYVIAAGRAEVLIDDGLGLRPVNSLRDGDFFGELALLSGEERTATVRAIDPCELYSLSREDFTVLMEVEPSVRVGIEQVLAGRRANAGAPG